MKVISPATYEAMLACFREKPGSANHCHNVVGVTRQTARKAWETGWPARGLPPLKEVVAGEQAKARAELEVARLAEEARVKAAAQGAAAAGAAPPPEAGQDATNIRVAEAQAIRSARSNAIGVMGVTARLLSGVVKLAVVAQAQLEQAAKDKKADPVQVAKLIRELSLATTRGAEAAHVAMVMERLWLGEPTDIIKTSVGVLGTDMTLEDVEKRMRASLSAVERARAKGLTVLTGGPTAPVPAESKPG